MHIRLSRKKNRIKNFVESRQKKNQKKIIYQTDLKKWIGQLQLALVRYSFLQFFFSYFTNFGIFISRFFSVKRNSILNTQQQNNRCRFQNINIFQLIQNPILLFFKNCLFFQLIFNEIRSKQHCEKKFNLNTQQNNRCRFQN